MTAIDQCHSAQSCLPVPPKEERAEARGRRLEARDAAFVVFYGYRGNVSDDELHTPAVTCNLVSRAPARPSTAPGSSYLTLTRGCSKETKKMTRMAGYARRFPVPLNRQGFLRNNVSSALGAAMRAARSLPLPLLRQRAASGLGEHVKLFLPSCKAGSRNALITRATKWTLQFNICCLLSHCEEAIKPDQHLLPIPTKT